MHCDGLPASSASEASIGQNILQQMHPHDPWRQRVELPRRFGMSPAISSMLSSVERGARAVATRHDLEGTPINETAIVFASLQTPFYRRFGGRLSILLLVIVIPALALTFYGNFRQRRIQKIRASEGSLAIANLAAANQENFVRNTSQLFDTLSQFSFLLLTTNRAFSETHFSNLRKLLPDYATFGIIETNGMAFCSADPLTNSVYLGDRQYFKRVLQTKKFAVGEFQVGRLSHEASLNFGYPILDEHGRLVRVLFASLKLSRLSQAIDHVQVPEGGAIALVDRGGALLARHAEVEKVLYDTNALRGVLVQKHGVFESRGSDGVSRLYAVAPVGSGSMPAFFVSVEIPLAVLFAKADKELLANLIVLGVITCVLFLIVRVYSRRCFLAPIKSLAAVAQNLTRGELGARVGVQQGAAELVQLGLALDEMAESVQARTADLVRSNGALRAQIIEREKAEELVRQQAEEKLKLEEQVLRSQRIESLGALAGGIAHDLNNALVPVIMGSQILQERGDHFADKRQVLELIATSGKRCTQMVKQILTFAKGSKENNSSVPVRHLLQEMAGIARDTFPKNIRVESRSPKDLWNVKGNATELHQILLNLCVNARDAMPNGGQLTLSAENIVLNDNLPASREAAPGSYVIITVSDTGSGIPPELRSRIFEPFFTTKPTDKGTGLGLSTVMNIIKRHAGFLELESEVGKGTRFKIHIPAVTSATTEESELKGAELPLGNGEVVLLVDDEVSVRELGKSTLANYGYRLLTAGNGLEAIACFELHKHEIRLIVMDADMPYLDGISALRRIRKIAPNVPVIIASASSYDTSYVSKLANVITLAKPYGIEDLVRGAAQALGNMPTPDKPSGATPVSAHV